MNSMTLKSIAKGISSGLTPLRSNKEYWDSPDVPWVKTEQLGERHIYDSNEKISKKALEQTGLKLNPENTLSIAMYGEGKTRGSVSILKREMTTNQACCNIVVDERKADYEYVYYFLKTQYNRLRSLSSGVRKNLNSNDIKNFEIRLPESIEAQRKIARVLSAFDTKIELNKKIIGELEAMAKLIYDYWFVQFDFPDSNGKAYKKKGGKMVWSEELKKEVPKGWEVVRMSELINFDKSGDWGKEEPEGSFKTRVVCIRGADINGLNGRDRLNPPTRYILEKNVFKILQPHDIVIEISGGSPTQSTGRLAFITEETANRFESPLICSNFCKPISMKNEKLLYNFVYNWNRLYDNGVFFGYEGKTSGIKNLLFDSFVSAHYFLIPDKNTVSQFYGFMENIQKKKQAALAESQKLSDLRDWLLPMLMNGQVKVADIKGELAMAAEPKVRYAKKKA